MMSGCVSAEDIAAKMSGFAPGSCSRVRRSGSHMPGKRPQPELQPLSAVNPALPFLRPVTAH
eukprot:4570644-Amphidinium_carterae.1